MHKKMPERISKVCIRWQTDSPFFAEFLLRFLYREDNKNCPTMAVGFHRFNHKLFFFYNSEFLEKLSDIEVEGICVHEILHVLHKFDERMGDRDKEIFNVAQDACINDIVEKTTIAGRELKVTEHGVRMNDINKMGYKGDPISEPVYKFLEDRVETIYIVSTGATGDGTGQCPNCGGSGEVDDDSGESEGKDSGGGKGNQKSSKGRKGTKKVQEEAAGRGEGKGKSEDKKKPCPVCGGSGKLHGKTVLQTTDDHTKHRKLTEIEKAVIQETINNAKTRSWGSISGNMQTEISELIKTKKIPWQRKLAMLMSKYVNEPGSIYENTWSKRNRRSLPLPGIRKLSKKIVVTVDTSGSIGQDDLMKFFGQIEKIIKDYSVMTLIQWDTEIQKVEQYKKGAWKNIEIKGRGGTDPQALYTLLHEQFKYLSVVVNFTDTYFDWGFEHYKIPTIWAVVNNPQFEAPFGKQVMIESEGESNDFEI